MERGVRTTKEDQISEFRHTKIGWLGAAMGYLNPDTGKVSIPEFISRWTEPFSVIHASPVAHAQQTVMYDRSISW